MNINEVNSMKRQILTEIDRRYRGSEKSLKAQLQFYLPYIQEVRHLGIVIDVGCGRGTFLEMVRDLGMTAIGFETNETQYNECTKKNLNVYFENAYNFMCRSECNKFGVITLFHVIEHLNFDDLTAIMMESYRVLSPGGIILIETPNSENLYVSTFNFNIDPTHVRPVTYQYISTVLEVIGFKCERLPIYASLHEDVGGETGNIHLDYLLSVSANLAVVGRKV